MKTVIAQPEIIFGGRIKVLLGLTKVLNSRGIIPEWMTYAMPGSIAEISKKYGVDAQFEVKILEKSITEKIVGKIPGEWSLAMFNAIVSRKCREENFDWIINSSNTLQGFSKFRNVLSYVHYPREARADSELADIHDPTSLPKLFSKNWIKKIACRLNYSRVEKISSEQYVVCNSNFTKEAVESIYGKKYFKKPIDVVYPFASDTAQIDEIGSGKKDLRIASLGRICSAKRQLEQAQMVASAEGIQLWIMGHAGEECPYYLKVKDIADQSNGRVSIFPNLPFSEVQERLSTCRYFLHTNINEPFGITPVEGILNGLIPIVHDSGGQKEVVPFPELRFRELSEVPKILMALEESRDRQRELLADLKERAQNSYSEAAFAIAANACLDKCTITESM